MMMEESNGMLPAGFVCFGDWHLKEVADREPECTAYRAERALDSQMFYSRVRVYSFASEEMAHEAARLLQSIKMQSDRHNPGILQDWEIRRNPDQAEVMLLTRTPEMESLEEYMADHQLDEKAVIQLGKSISSALDHCGHHGVFFKAIRPECILMDSDTGSFVPDTARLALQSCSQAWVHVRDIHFCAPEILNGLEPDIRSEIYSLGLLLYILRNGNRPPFCAPGRILSTEEKMENLRRRVSGAPLPPPADVSPELAALILKACQYDPKRRYQDANEFLRELNALSDSFDRRMLNAAGRESLVNALPPDDFAKKKKSGAIASLLTLFAPFRFRKTRDVRPSASPVRDISDISRVSFSALSDQDVQRKRYHALRIFMYEEGQRAEMERMKEAVTDLPKETRSGAPVHVGRGQMITVRLTSSSAVIEDGEQTLPWEGQIREFSFSYLVPEETTADSIQITAGIYIDQVPATRLQIIIPVRDGQADPSVSRTDIHEGFMSYSSGDRKDVLKIAQGMHRARPDLQLFLDVESLRSGEDWNRAIQEKIRGCDMLFLCWSRSAKASEWVDYEWRYAFQTKGAAFIEPIPLEPPALCPPPAELQDKHFNDVDMLLSLSERYVERELGK